MEPFSDPAGHCADVLRALVKSVPPSNYFNVTTMKLWAIMALPRVFG
ncbi:MAG: hypothetical protein WCF33_19550 [Pseudonocardiaceae bacterium]